LGSTKVFGFSTICLWNRKKSNGKTIMPEIMNMMTTALETHKDDTIIQNLYLG
jgi:hypothetical protein